MNIFSNYVLQTRILTPSRIISATFLLFEARTFGSQKPCGLGENEVEHEWLILYFLGYLWWIRACLNQVYLQYLLNFHVVFLFVFLIISKENIDLGQGEGYFKMEYIRGNMGIPSFWLELKFFIDYYIYFIYYTSYKLACFDNKVETEVCVQYSSNTFLYNTLKFN